MILTRYGLLCSAVDISCAKGYDILNLQIAENGKEIRKAFIEKFTLTKEEFARSRKEYIDTLASKGTCVNYEELYLWELMDHRSISFSSALGFLRSLGGEVFFMSENESNPNCVGIGSESDEYKGAVAKMDASELADLIEYEWNEGWRLSMFDRYLENTVLPEDIYVFDGAMEHLLVFTHENDHWELEIEEPMKAAASRFCMMNGFPLPDGVPYERIRAMLEAELSPNSSLEIELSYSCSMFFRQFTVSKWMDTEKAGYEYRFDFAPDTGYSSWEEAENAKVINGMSLNEISRMKSVRFEIISVDGN